MTAPIDPAELAKDPKVAAAVLRAEGAGRTGPDGRVWRMDECDRFLARADKLDPPEPVDPPMLPVQLTDAQIDAAGRAAQNAYDDYPISDSEWYGAAEFRAAWLKIGLAALLAAHAVDSAR